MHETREGRRTEDNLTRLGRNKKTNGLDEIRKEGEALARGRER